MKIIFKNLSLQDIIIYIDPNKTIDDLIRFYFEINKRVYLYRDKKIIFFIDGKKIAPPYPRESIETLKNKVLRSETIRIIVFDPEDKMRKTYI